MKYRRFLTLIFSVMMLNTLISCGEPASEQPQNLPEDPSKTDVEDTEVQSSSDVISAEKPSMAELYTEISNAVEFPDMYVLDERTAEKYFGVNREYVSDVYAAVADEYPTIDRLYIARIKDMEYAQESVNELEKTLKTLQDDYIDYLPAEYLKAKDAKVYQNEDFICLMITSDNKTASDIIQSYY